MSISLWEFASSCYQRAGIAEVCLALQDGAEADINMLLAAAWLGADVIRWQPEDVAAITQACRQWRSACLLPLRQIRRDLKGLVAADNWYQRIKALELEAERYQLRLIEDAVQPLSATTDADRSTAITNNLHVYLATLSAVSTGRCHAEITQLKNLLLAAP